MPSSIDSTGNSSSGQASEPLYRCICDNVRDYGSSAAWSKWLRSLDMAKNKMGQHVPSRSWFISDEPIVGLSFRSGN